MTRQCHQHKTDQLGRLVKLVLALESVLAMSESQLQHNMTSVQAAGCQKVSSISKVFEDCRLSRAITAKYQCDTDKQALYTELSSSQ